MKMCLKELCHFPKKFPCMEMRQKERLRIWLCLLQGSTKGLSLTVWAKVGYILFMSAFCHLKNSNYSWNQEWVYYWIYICVWQSLQWFRSISSAIFPIMLLMNQWWLSMGMIKIRMSCMFLCQSMTVNLYKSYIWVLRYWADPSPLSAFCQSFPKGNHPSFGFPARTLATREAGCRSIGTFSSQVPMVVNLMFFFINFEFLYELRIMRSIVKLFMNLWDTRVPDIWMQYQLVYLYPCYL